MSMNLGSPRTSQYCRILCHLPRAQSYSGVRTWVEGSQMRGDRALAKASNLLGYKTHERVGRDNILVSTGFVFVLAQSKEREYEKETR